MRLRTATAYRSAFGIRPTPESGFLDLAEVAPFAAALRTLGATTPAQVAAQSVTTLTYEARIPADRAAQVRRVARLAMTVDGGCAEWRIDITRILLDLGIRELPPTPPVADLAAAVRSGLGALGLRREPAPDVVETWLAGHGVPTKPTA